MRLFLLSDNEQTIIGLRLAGVEGAIINDKNALLSKLDELILNTDIGMILITTPLADTIQNQLIEIKKNSSALIVEIPVNNQEYHSDSITRYVRDAIGIKI